MAARIPRDKKNDHTDEMAQQRRDFVKEHTGVTLEHVGKYSIDPASTNGNIENFIGVTQTPIGLAGPVLVNGEHAKGEFYVPMATSEGTLVASYNRGMRLLREAGGIKVSVVDDAMQRAPVFIFNDAREAREFGVWVKENLPSIQEVAQSTTKSGKLRNIEQYAAARMLYLRFNFTTGDAAGQNMVTLAAKTACDFIKAKTGDDFILESGFNSDKKASARNMILGRGHSVIAETTITNSVLRRILGIKISDVEKFQQVGPTVTRMAGTEGCHLHVSNALTAIYLATGQDTACVAENSLGHYQTEPVNHGMKFRLTLPSITVGTVGGGTRLLPQNQNLKLLGCNTGKYSSRKLAEIICASSLALEISLMSAIASGTFAKAHMIYGR